jgi:hypothetical protein
MRSTILAVVALMLVPLGEVAPQAALPTSGDRIRITAASYGLENRTARVVNVRSDSLFLHIAPAETLAVALAGVTRLDVSFGRRRYPLQGAGIGSLIGVTSGVLIGYASGDDPPGWFAFTAGEKAVLAGVGLGLTGLVVGTVVGLLKTSDRWMSVPLGAAEASPRLQVSRGGARLAVAVPFSP